MISWTERVRNEEVLQSQEGEKYPTYNKKEEDTLDRPHPA
jgi:hypothetical protein